MTETEFNLLAEKIFQAIEFDLDQIAADSDLDIDTQKNGNVLEISLLGRHKIILNTQRPLKEIWLAAPLGAVHFAHTATGWYSAREQKGLRPMLEAWLTELTKKPCRLTVLAQLD